MRLRTTRVVAIFCLLTLIPTAGSISIDRAVAEEAERQSVADSGYEPLPDFDVRWLASRERKPREQSLLQSLSVERPAQLRLTLRWNEQMQLPHSLMAYGAPLTPQSSEDASEVAKAFVLANERLFRLTRDQFESARVCSLNTDLGAGFTRLVLEQRVHGVRVFDSEMLFALDSDRRLISVSGCFIPNLEQIAPKPVAVLKPEDALRLAVISCGGELAGELSLRPDRNTSPDRFFFSAGEIDRRSEAGLVYYPISDTDVRAAYQIMLYGVPSPIDSYLVLVDANSGQLLRRDSLTCAMEAPSARVFTGENPKVSDVRELVELSGDATASPAGWVSASRTEGNNAQVFVNLDLGGGGMVKPARNGNFDFPLDLSSGQSPLEFFKASAANLFYWVNFCHDRFYGLGFDESWRNFQKDNLGRGGTGGDQIRAETLRGAGVDPAQTNQLVRNNAFFQPTIEGTQPLLAMLLWTGSVDGRVVEFDSSYDAGVIIHEFTHGVSTRLAGTDTATGLRSLQGYGMGEGWSDFFALSFLDKGEGPLDAPVTAGAYITNRPGRGVRAFPYSTDVRRNPLTFGDIAFNSEVHAQGTVWCTMLWEMRQALIARYGFEAGRAIAEQLVTAGLKLLPIAPLFTDGRDAILLADTVLNSGANQELIWRAFARRGLGMSAGTSETNTLIGFRIYVAEAYDILPEHTRGDLIINEKPTVPAVLGEPLPLLLLDKDIQTSGSITLQAENLRTRETAPVTLITTAAGRFAGSLTVGLPGGSETLSALPGDSIVIRYSNARNAAGTSETLEVQTLVGRRITVYSDDFDGDTSQWRFPSNPDSAKNHWHFSDRRSTSGSRSLYFAKEKASSSFVPRQGKGVAVSPIVDLGELSKARLEIDWWFSGFAGNATGSADMVNVTASNVRASADESPISAAFTFRPLAESRFRRTVIDLRAFENQRAGITCSFTASGAAVDRKGYEGCFLDGLRITAVTTRQ